eukprot:6647149-Prymnesium_polylepis.1
MRRRRTRLRAALDESREWREGRGDRRAGPSRWCDEYVELCRMRRTRHLYTAWRVPARAPHIREARCAWRARSLNAAGERSVAAPAAVHCKAAQQAAGAGAGRARGAQGGATRRAAGPGPRVAQ